MYYPESERIAANHPEAREAIEDLDRYLHENEGRPIRVERIADLLDLPPSQVERFLRVYKDAGVVAWKEFPICPICGDPIESPEESGELFCDLCEEGFAAASVDRGPMYRPEPSTTGGALGELEPAPVVPVEPEPIPERFADDPFQFCPLLSYFSRSVAGTPLRGKRVVFLLHFLRDLLPFVEAASLLGLEPTASRFYYKQYPYPQRESVGRWLEEQGYLVRSILDLDADLAEVAAADPDIVGDLFIVEDGGHIYPQIIRSHPSLLHNVKGCVEQTARGSWNIEEALRDVEERPSIPVLSVADCDLKSRFEPPHIGDAVVRNIRRLLGNVNFRGRKVAVLGFGAIGREVAEKFHQEGCRVSVFDVDVSVRLAADQAGFHTEDSAEAVVRDKDIVVGASGRAALGREELLSCRHGTKLASASSEQYEVAIAELENLSGGRKREYRSGDDVAGTVYKLRRGETEVILLANGYPVNFWGWESMPNEASDLVVTLLLLSLAELARGEVRGSGILSAAVDEIATRYKVADLYLRHHK